MNGWVIVAGDFVRHGGMDRANLELARFLAADRPVHLVTHKAADELKTLPNVIIHHVHRPLGKHFLGHLLLARAGRRLAARLSEQGHRVIVNGSNCPWPDVNWVHYVHAAYRPTLSMSGLRRWKAWAERPLRLRAEAAALRGSRVVVCNSHLTRRTLIEVLGVDARKAVTVYFGTNPDEFHPASPVERAGHRARFGWSESLPVVLFIGALGDHRKGFDVLFAAWKTLCESSSWDALLAVVGRGAELSVWRERAAGAGLANRIHFLGFRDDVPDLLRAADALVHPARYEAYGLGVHEALCCGLPAIVSSSAGVAERYPWNLANLLVADPESPVELAGRLRYWRENSVLLADTIRPFGDELRSRNWADMARDIVTAVEGIPPPQPLPARPGPAPAAGSR